MDRWTDPECVNECVAASKIYGLRRLYSGICIECGVERRESVEACLREGEPDTQSSIFRKGDGDTVFRGYRGLIRITGFEEDRCHTFSNGLDECLDSSVS